MKKYILPFIVVCSIICGDVFAQNTSPAPYCVASFDDNPNNVQDYIKSVSISTLSNITNAQFPFPHYVLYDNLPAPDAIPGLAYNLAITFNVIGNCGYGVWIDFNHNNVFDAPEKVAGTVGTNPMIISTNTTISNLVSIPITAIIGSTRMRVRLVEDSLYTNTNGFNINPCNTGTTEAEVMNFGETEDYIIHVGMTPIGIHDIENKINISVYPNPIQEQLFIQSTTAFSDVKMYNLMSVLVYENNIKETKQLEINTSCLARGMYMVIVDGKFTQMLTKE